MDTESKHTPSHCDYTECYLYDICNHKDTPHNCSMYRDYIKLKNMEKKYVEIEN